MDSEIRAIMAQYMPLDSQADIPVHHAPRGDIWRWADASSKPAASPNYKALSAFILLSLSVMFLSRHW
jgi:hypothetical protein